MSNDSFGRAVTRTPNSNTITLSSRISGASDYLGSYPIFHYRWFMPWCGSVASVIGAGMEPKPNPFLVVSLIHGGGDQTHLYFTLATAVIVALAIFVTAFLLGLFCGRGWRPRRQMRLEAAANLKRRARA